MAPHSSTLAWKIPWMEEPGRLQSMGSLRVGHDWATSLSLFTFLHWRRKWQPTPVFLPGESQGWGSPVTSWLKWLSSSSSICFFSKCFKYCFQLFWGPCVDQTFSFVLFMLYLLVFNYTEVSLSSWHSLNLKCCLKKKHWIFNNFYWKVKDLFF